MIGVMRPTDQIRAGRRLIESLPRVALLADLTWFGEVRAWGMHSRLTIDSKNPGIIPRETEWWVTLSETYPYGKIVFYPANGNGITQTFPHQQYNGREHPSAPWRMGDICVRSPQFTFGKYVLDPDPIGRPERLAWYFGRATEWLEAAANSSLLADGAPFELPQFSAGVTPQHTVAHAETAETYLFWKDNHHWYGTAELVAVGPPKTKAFAVRRFFHRNGKELLSYSWGCDVIASARLVQPAIWLRCQSMPVIEPYQAIDTWGELFGHMRKEGREESFQCAVDLIRDGKSHFLLLGFPIPNRVGQNPCQLHWQPILVPMVSHGTQFANGFRPNQLGYWMRDRSKSFPSDGQPDWHPAQNWSREETTGRGRIDEAVACHSTLVIGVGAVGSVASELLVRSGVGPVVVCDGDHVEYGNLCRHTLRLEDIGQNKAESVSARLAGTHAHADVRFIAELFPPKDETNLALADDCDLILDCTGDDSTLHDIVNHQWQREKFFCSISLSYKAMRIYVFTSRGNSFPLADFQRQVHPWLEKDREAFSDEELVQAGVGCWHPAFPARVDDIWMLTAAAIRRLEEAMVAAEKAPCLVVFEQVLDAERFYGIRRM